MGTCVGCQFGKRGTIQHKRTRTNCFLSISTLGTMLCTSFLILIAAQSVDASSLLRTRKENSSNEDSTSVALVSSWVPQGLLPGKLSGPTHSAHTAVVNSQWGVSVTPCRRRLEQLRQLVNEGKLEEAIDASFILDRRDGLHSACLEDKPFVGEATLVAQAARSSDTGQSHFTSFIQLHDDDDDASDRDEEEEEEGGKDSNKDSSKDLNGKLAPKRLFKVLFAGPSDRQRPRSVPRTVNVRSDVVGFSLEGTFVLAETSVRCKRRQNVEAGAEHNREAGVEAVEKELKAPPAPFSSPSLLLCDGGAHLRGFLASDSAGALKEMEEHKQQRRTGNGATTTRLEETPEHDEEEGEEDEGEKGQRRRLVDVSNNYARGAKRVLAIPIIPSDSPNGATSAAPFGYCYGKVQSEFGCTAGGVQRYLNELLRISANFYSKSSWGALTITPTTTPILSANYRGNSCGSHGLLETRSAGGSAFDSLGFTAATQAGFTPSSFDFTIVFIPRCRGIGFSGYAWIGRPGVMINLFGVDSDASVSHELGHNFGANHASSITSGSRGRVAWVDGQVSEYGNPHTAMGSCRSDSDTCDLLIEGKQQLDWVSNAHVPLIVNPLTDCNPSCGPYELYQTDFGSKPTGAPLMGLQIATSTANRFFFVEHRTKTTSGAAALISWSDVNDRSGATGTYGESYLTDCTPNTGSVSDAGCKPRTRVVLDVGRSGASRRIVVVVGGVSNRRLQVYVSTNLNFQIPNQGTPQPPATVVGPGSTKAQRVAARRAARRARRIAARRAARNA